MIAGPATELGRFDELLLSWDVSLGASEGARLEVRVRAGATWSAWLTAAERGDRDALERELGAPVRDDPIARVDVDIVICKKDCTAAEWRIRSVGDMPSVHEVWVTATESDAGGAVEPRLAGVRIEHDVPHKAQREGGSELGGRLCSPTSTAMVLASQGYDIGVLEMSERVYDSAFDLYGNWVNNTLAACELGVPMRATRIGSWEEAARYLRRGPIVVSLPPFVPNEIEGAGYASRSGHLIVIRGLDGRGGVLVRDPAHSEESARVYRQAQLTRLWLMKNKGTAYVLDSTE